MSEIWVFATELLDDLEYGHGDMTELTDSEKTMLKYIINDWLDRIEGEGDEYEGNKER